MHDPEIFRYVRNREASAQPRSCVPYVKRKDGTTSSVAGDIVDEFTAFYRVFFTSDVSISPESDEASAFLSGVPQIPQELRDALCSPVTASELREIVFAMKTGSSAGADGLPIDFCRQFWSALSSSVVTLINAFIDTGRVHRSYKDGRVVLLLKGPDNNPGDPCSYRPIALLNADSKILTSLLAQRLRVVLPCPVQEHFFVLAFDQGSCCEA